MNFRARPDMYVIAPKVQLAHYVDNTMPRRPWNRFEVPTCKRAFLAPRYRTTVSTRETAPNLSIIRQAG